jgi:hypothetical protein
VDLRVEGDGWRVTTKKRWLVTFGWLGIEENFIMDVVDRGCSGFEAKQSKFCHYTSCICSKRRYGKQMERDRL